MLFSCKKLNNLHQHRPCLRPERMGVGVQCQITHTHKIETCSTGLSVPLATLLAKTQLQLSTSLLPAPQREEVTSQELKTEMRPLL